MHATVTTWVGTQHFDTLAEAEAFAHKCEQGTARGGNACKAEVRECDCSEHETVAEMAARLYG